jgi:hypothetical protein
MFEWFMAEYASERAPKKAQATIVAERMRLLIG